MELDMTRRDILKTVAKTTVGFSAVSEVLGANDRVRVAVCGLKRARQRSHPRIFPRAERRDCGVTARARMRRGRCTENPQPCTNLRT